MLKSFVIKTFSFVNIWAQNYFNSYTFYSSDPREWPVMYMCAGAGSVRQRDIEIFRLNFGTDLMYFCFSFYIINAKCSNFVVMFPFMKGFMTKFFKSPQFGGTEDFFKQVVSEILKDRRTNPRVSNISLNILIITNIMFYKKYSRMKICAYVCCFYKTNILKKVSVMLRKTKIRFCVTKIKILCIKFKL
jgi:hypothetical protein